MIEFSNHTGKIKGIKVTKYTENEEIRLGTIVLKENNQFYFLAQNRKIELSNEDLLIILSEIIKMNHVRRSDQILMSFEIDKSFYSDKIKPFFRRLSKLK